MNLVISGSVTVIGVLALIWLTKRGITEPRDAITLPYRVTQMVLWPLARLRDFATATFSISAFDIPIALIGYTALSVLNTITFFTPLAMAAFSVFSVPRMLVATASMG